MTLLSLLGSGAGTSGVLCRPTGNGPGVWSVYDYTKLLARDNDPVIASKDDDSEREAWPMEDPGMDATTITVYVWQKRQQQFTFPGRIDVKVNGVTEPFVTLGGGTDGSDYVLYVVTFAGSWSAADFLAGWEVGLTSLTDNGQGPPGPMLLYDQIYAIVR